MPTDTERIQEIANQEYKYGFVTDVEADSIPPGLDENVVRLISAKKEEPEFLLEWRLKAYQHWLTMTEPKWPNVHYPPIDFKKIVYYSAPKSKDDGPKSLDEVEPELLETYKKLGIPLEEQELLAGVAVDAVLTASRSPLPTRKSWENWESSSVPSPKQYGSTPNWSKSIWARSCLTPTTFMQL